MAKEKIASEQKKRPGLYQSGEHPKHYSNEGGEYISNGASDEADKSDTKDNADFDKINGRKVD